MEPEIDVARAHWSQGQPFTTDSKSDPIPTQGFLHSRIKTNGGDVGSHNQFNLYHFCNVSPDDGYHGANRMKLRLGQLMWDMGKGRGCPLTKESREQAMKCGPEPSLGGRVCPAIDRRGHVPTTDNNTDQGQVDIPHDCDDLVHTDEYQLSSTSTVLITGDKFKQRILIDTIINVYDQVTQHPRSSREPYTTLILHLGNHIKHGQVKFSDLKGALEKYIPLPMKVKLSQSKSTLFCYPGTSYTDANLGGLRDAVWSQICPLLGVHTTDSWRLKLFNSWPSIVIHNVPVGSSNKLLAPPDLYARVKSELAQHSETADLQLDDIKSIRCLIKGEKVQAKGEVSMKVSFGHRENARHFLEHGASIFGAQCRTSSYIPRKSRRRRSHP